MEKGKVQKFFSGWGITGIPKFAFITWKTREEAQSNLDFWRGK